MKKEQYKVIVKAGPTDFKKWHVRNLISFTKFLDKEHKGWRWFNVYDKGGKQIANYTKNNPPRYSRVKE